jgi:hypothetical protein
MRLLSFLQFCAKEEKFRDFVSDVQSNARRYISLFAEAADDLMPESTLSVAEEDSFDVLMRQARHPFIQKLSRWKLLLVGLTFVFSFAEGTSRG